LAHNVIDGLRQMGHEPLALGVARPGAAKRRINFVFDLAMRSASLEASTQKILVQRARRLRAELVLSVDARLSPAAIEGFAALGCPVGLWFPDHVANLGRQLMFVGAYDWVFVKEPLLAERARAILGTQILYVPEACNPTWHVPPTHAPARREIAVVGNMYPYRVRLLERMVGVGLPIRIYGPQPPPWLPSAVLEHHTGAYVAGAEKAQVFRGAAAVLNALHPAELSGVNCRLFEATACGGAVLTETRPALDDLFKSGDEVLTFTTFDELVDRARWALDNEQAARAIGDRASTRALSDHTYAQRLEVIVGTLTGQPVHP
jgi:spore maturation protein CgeB